MCQYIPWCYSDTHFHWPHTFQHTACFHVSHTQWKKTAETLMFILTYCVCRKICTKHLRASLISTWQCTKYIVRTLIWSFWTPWFGIVDVDFLRIVFKRCQVCRSFFDVWRRFATRREQINLRRWSEKFFSPAKEKKVKEMRYLSETKKNIILPLTLGSGKFLSKNTTIIWLKWWYL